MPPARIPMEGVTLSQARELVRCLAAHESVLLLSPPGVGKSDLVHQAARGAGLEVRSLLGTQIAPEDVVGVPRILGERCVFCPPRTLLGDGRPFCLFLDELPACPPEVQKAFYSLLLERRVGEYPLPAGTWVVAAGNRGGDRAMARTLSSALVNRLFVVPVRVDRDEWLAWAAEHGIREEIRLFITMVPAALQRPVPAEPVPYSTPRSWALLSRDLDLAEAAGRASWEERRALAFGRLSAADAALFCVLREEGLAELRRPHEYLDNPSRLPATDTGLWFMVAQVRTALQAGELVASPDRVNRFLLAVPEEFRFTLLLDLVPAWAALGANEAMFAALGEVTGLCQRRKIDP